MGTKITINTVIECVNQKSAKILLMEAMKNELCAYLLPKPNSIESREKVEEWKLQNWGDYCGPFFEAGWLTESTLIMKLTGGSPQRIYNLLKSSNLVKSVTLNYLVHDDFISSKECGIYDEHEHQHFTNLECY
jgi:hypothetical protein